MRWRFIDSIGPTTYDIDCNARLHDFMSTRIATNPSTAVLSLYGSAKRGMHAEYTYKQKVWLRPIEQQLLAPFYKELKSIAGAYAEDVAAFIPDPKQYDMSFLFDEHLDVKTGLADVIDALNKGNTPGATMLRSLFRDIERALEEFHVDEQPIHKLKKPKPTTNADKLDVLDADEAWVGCGFGNEDFKRRWAKFVEQKAAQLGRAETNVSFYTKQPATNELILAISVGTMEAVMAGDEVAKQKALQCAGRQTLGRYAKAALNVALRNQ